MRIIIPVLLTFFGWAKMAQSQSSFNHPTNTSNQHTLIPGIYTYYDSGGPAGDYTNNEDGSITFCPSSDNEVIRVFFSEVSIELLGSGACQDVLTVSGDAHNNNGDFCGDGMLTVNDPFRELEAGMVFEAAPGDCLTFEFKSDGSIFQDGWSATIDVRAPVSCACDFDCGQTLICDGFENYAPWPLSLQSDDWTKRDPGAADAVAVSDVKLKGKQSLRIQQSGILPEAALLLGDSTGERFRMSWNTLVESGSDGRFTFFHNESMDHEAFQVRMTGGTGQLFILDNPGASAANFSYQENSWVYIMVIIDLDRDLAELWVEGQFIAGWQFSRGQTSGGTVSNLNQLGAVLFSSGTVCYLDELCFTVLNCEPDACADGQPCPVIVNGTQIASQCEACCLGYTADEWVPVEETPQVAGLSDSREWVNQGVEIVLQEINGDSVLFVDSRAIDTLNFRPNDVLLSNYCSGALEIEVEDQRPSNVDAYCFSFDVIWRVLESGTQIDSFSLNVIVECNIPLSVDSITFKPTMQTFQSGDTLRLTSCGVFARSDFEAFTGGCEGNVAVAFQPQNLQWIGDLPEDQQGDDEPCLRGELVFSASQCESVSLMSFVLYIEVRDEVAPTFTAPPQVTVSCLSELDSLSKTGMISDVAESCGILDTNYVDDITRTDACLAEVIRTWEVRDSCGNVATATQRILVEDKLPPIFSPPAEVTIDSVSQLDDLTVTGTVSNARDNCGIRDTTYVDDRSRLEGCTGTVVRTWTLTDSCGGATSAIQVINVSDAEPPQVTAPSDREVDCLEALSDQQLAGTISGVSDNVGVRDTTYSEDISGLNGCKGSVIRSWTVTDSCGNQTTVSQTVTIRDDIAPTFVAPFQVTLECLGDLDNLDLTGRPLFVSDNCEVSDTSYTDEVTQVDDCIYSVRRSWTVSDRCGNTATKEQLIQVADTQAPTFTAPGEVTVTAAQLDDLSLTGMVSSVADNCEISDTSYTDALFQEATCREEGWIIRTWRVTDGCGNFSEASQDIFYTLDVPLADAGADREISCLQPTAQLDATGSAVGPNIAYEWQTDQGNIVSGGATLQPVVDAAGTYTLIVSNTSSGCSGSDQLSVTRINDLDPNVVGVTDVRCAGSTTGVITISPQGGNPPYDIRWSNGMTDNQITGLPAGDYSVTVTDSGNCQATTSVNVGSPDPITLNIEVLQGSRCDTIPTGEASAQVSGGTSPFQYFWDNVEGVSTADSLAAGDHMLVVRDVNGCSMTRNFTMPEAVPAVSQEPLPDLCADDLPLSLEGGAPVGGTYRGPGVSGGRFDPALAGTGTHPLTYSYTAPNGCSDSVTTSITVHALPQLTDTGFDPVCINEDTVQLNFVEPAGGVYSGPGISRKDILEPAIAGAGSFPVLYSFRDPATGCASNLASLIKIEPAAEVRLDVSASDTTLCENEVLELRAVIQNGGEAPSYSWMINGQLQGADTSIIVTNLPPGLYMVQGALTTSMGCVTARTVADSLTIRVDSVTMEVMPPATDTICSNAGPYRLQDGMPAGGVFSGIYVENGLFRTDESGAGIFTLSYTVQDTVTGCPITERFELMVDICTNLALPLQIQRLEVYPNPAHSLLRVDVESELLESVVVELWDSQGRRVRSQQHRALSGAWNAQMEVGDLPGGTYWLRLSGEQFQAWRKVIVQ